MTGAGAAPAVAPCHRIYRPGTGLRGGSYSLSAGSGWAVRLRPTSAASWVLRRRVRGFLTGSASRLGELELGLRLGDLRLGLAPGGRLDWRRFRRSLGNCRGGRCRLGRRGGLGGRGLRRRRLLGGFGAA